jgi:DNA-binding transcriptional LysR family regulator
MRHLNLDYLRSLMTIAELGSFSAAARRLDLTQPAISLQIRDLETRLGVRLIERSGKHATPTAAGRDLIAHAERLLTESDRALAAMREHKEGRSGRVRIGTGPTAFTYLLPPVIERLRRSHPGIELVVTTGSTNDIERGMLAGALDLGFTALPVDERELDVVPVRTDDVVAIFCAGEKDIPAIVTPADVEGRRLILEYQPVPQLRMIRAWLNAGGVTVRTALELDSIDAMKEAVARGLGMSFVPVPAIANAPPTSALVVRPLDPPLSRTLGLIQRRNRPMDSMLRVVRDAILTLANAGTTAESRDDPGAAG